MKHTLIVAVAACILSAGAFAAEKPNVIIILSDDAGYADFGFTDGALAPTPHLDRLAESGIVCTQGYVSGSTCAPSRMGLMSGRYQQRFGAECNVPTIPTPGFTKADLGLDTGERTLGQVMRGEGYRTMAIGKWHLGELPQYHPNMRGFDEFYGFLGGSRSYWDVENPNRGHAMRRQDTPVDEAGAVTYLTDDLTEEAVAFIGRNTEGPFFLYLAYNAVHGPFDAKEADLERYEHMGDVKRRTVAAMTHAMDVGVGRLLDTLTAHNLRENTLVVFLNDPGGTQGDWHFNGG